MTAINNRYDFVYLFEVANGNPNGDPDAGNMPRIDPETSQGLVTDVCLKRKVRNYVSIAKGNEPGYEIYISERAILNNQHQRARDEVLPDSASESDAEKKKLPKDKETAQALTAWMCANFFDIRAFGAVMTTGVNCGQVRGPVQFTFSRSVESVLPLEVSITRMAATSEKDAENKGDIRTMGRKHIIPYGLYRAHGYVSACLANEERKGTGFSEDDLELLWTALEQMFDHDRSAARGEMTARRLILFKHQSELGNAPAHRLFDRITIKRQHEGNEYDLGKCPVPARAYEDYIVCVNNDNLPDNIEIIDRIV